MAEARKLNGLEMAAVLLLSLEEDMAAEIMKHLKPAEVHELSGQMRRVEDLSRDDLMSVTEKFREEAGSTIVLGDDEFLKNTLTKALGPDRAGMIIDQITSGVDGGGLEALKWMEPKVIADLIRNEHPQTLAVIMSNLEPEHACQVLSNLESRLRTDVIMRVATMESVTPLAMKELDGSIKELLSGNTNILMRTVGGVKRAAEMLNHMDTSTESAIITDIEKSDNELAAMIQDQMFVFSDLISVDDRGIQALLKDTASDQLILALKVADDGLKEKFLKNMSERAAEMLKEDMEAKGPVKLTEVENAKKEILKIAKTLEQEGKLVREGKGGDDVLV